MYLDPSDAVRVNVPWQWYVAVFLAMFVLLWPLWHALEPAQGWEGEHSPQRLARRRGRHRVRGRRRRRELAARLDRAKRGIRW